MKRANVSTWSRCHATDEAAIITKEKSYHKQDDENTEVNEEDVISGYRYGTTLVPFTGKFFFFYNFFFFLRKKKHG